MHTYAYPCDSMRSFSCCSEPESCSACGLIWLVRFYHEQLSSMHCIQCLLTLGTCSLLLTFINISDTSISSDISIALYLASFHPKSACFFFDIRLANSCLLSTGIYVDPELCQSCREMICLPAIGTTSSAISITNQASICGCQRKPYFGRRSSTCQDQEKWLCFSGAFWGSFKCFTDVDSLLEGVVQAPTKPVHFGS